MHFLTVVAGNGSNDRLGAEQAHLADTAHGLAQAFDPDAPVRVDQHLDRARVFERCQVFGADVAAQLLASARQRLGGVVGGDHGTGMTCARDAAVNGVV